MSLLPWSLIWVLTLCVVPAHGSLGEGGTQGSRPTPAQVRRELDAARTRWQSNSIPYYRIRVSTAAQSRRSFITS